MERTQRAEIGAGLTQFDILRNQLHDINSALYFLDRRIHGYMANVKFFMSNPNVEICDF
jgi:hypothetical protein